MKPAVIFPDAERAVVDYLTDELDEPGAGVGITLPSTWTPASPPFARVATDGPPRPRHSIYAVWPIRIVVFAKDTTTAKRIATRALGVLAAHDGRPGIARVKPGTGPLADHDPKTNAEIAAVTLDVTVRSTPLEPSGS